MENERKEEGKWSLFWEIIYFPILLIYLEVVFHIYMNLEMMYAPVFVGFAMAMGMIFSTVCILLPGKVNKAVRSLLTLFVSVLFCVEMICRDILQQYYQLFSAVDTAMGNRLSDYWDAIKVSLVGNWLGLVLLLVVPGACCALMVFRVKPLKKIRYGAVKRAAVLIPLCAVLHLVGLSSVKLIAWEGDFTPDKLYYMDINTEDQVEQLGIVTMLRLDAKHTMFGCSYTPEIVITPEPEFVPEEIVIEPEEVVVEEPEPVYEEQILEIDLQQVLDTAKNGDVEWLTNYILSVSPTKENEYTGLFEGYNVIFITAEGFSGYVIDEELTPTMYRMVNEGFVFENFYSALHFTSTSGGEFQNLTGLYPKNGFPISMTETGEQGTYLPFTLANALNGDGYTSIGYHYNENMYGRTLSHPNLGYDWRQVSGCENPVQKEASESGNVYWPQSDDYMVEDSIGDYIGETPFNIYYLTISGHLPYGYYSNEMAQRNWEAVENLEYSDTTKAYIAATIELEKGLARMVDELEKAGIADNTVIVMAPDHVPYSDIDVLAELAGHFFGSDTLEMLDEQNIDFDVYKSALIMWSASMEEPVHVEKTCCQVDVLPTLLNLLGVEFDSRMMAGRDILSEAEGLVVFTSNSWISDKGLYNRFSGTFTPAEGVDMTEEEIDSYVEKMKTEVSCRLAMTSIIIENDYYREVLENN